MIDLPSGWRWTTVGEAGRVDLGRQRHPDWHTGPEMRPYLRVANVFEDRIDASNLKEMDFSGGVFERFQLHPGDVLLNEGQSPEWLGRPAIYRGIPEVVAFTNTLIRFRAHPDVLPEWALTVFRHHMHSGRFIREARITTNIAHLSAARLKAVEFPVPPLRTQLRIVAVLEDHLSRLDAATDYATAAARRAALLSAAVLRGQRLLSEAPSVPLREVLAGGLSNGRSVPTLIGGFPVLRLTALGKHRVQLEQRKGGAWSLAEARPFLIERDDYLVSRGNGSLKLVGRGAPVVDEPDPVAYPDTLIRVRVDPTRLNLAYLHLIWNSAGVRQQIEAMARTTAGIYKVNQTHLESTLLPLPSLQDQRSVVDSVSQVADAAERLSAEALAVVGEARRLRRALLAAAFSGRLSGGSSDLDVAEEGAQGEGATQAASVGHP